jgi:hypothetical protein
MKIKITYPYPEMPNKEITARVMEVGEDNVSKLTMVKNVEKLAEERVSRMDKLRKGITGLTKATLGIGLASEYEIQARRDICDTCEYRSGSQCGGCGCFIKSKTKLAKEKCPKGFWGQEITIEDNKIGGCGCGKNKK